MKLRKLTQSDVVFSVHISEEDIPVRGNAMASGDDAADKEDEDNIIARLNAGDLWAWCCVEVRATYNRHSSDTKHSAGDILGCCSYSDESDFRSCMYFEDMCKAALDRLNAYLAATLESLPIEAEGA
jgi:hypothetical protein